MSEVVTKSYIGVGKVWVRPYGTTGKLRHVGNVSALAVRHTLDIQRQPDYMRSGGGTAVRVERVQAVECNMTWLHYNPENWAIACAGTATTVEAGTATDEWVALHKGALARLAHPPTAITSVTDEGGVINYVAGDDYELSGGGLYVPLDSGIVDAADHEVTYTYGEYTRVEGSMGTATVLEMFFEGLNDADNGKPMLVDLWRASVPPAEEIALIGLTLGEMAFASELLKDPSKGAGVSAFYRARML